MALGSLEAIQRALNPGFSWDANAYQNRLDPAIIRAVENARSSGYTKDSGGISDNVEYSSGLNPFAATYANGDPTTYNADSMYRLERVPQDVRNPTGNAVYQMRGNGDTVYEYDQDGNFINVRKATSNPGMTAVMGIGSVLSLGALSAMGALGSTVAGASHAGALAGGGAAAGGAAGTTAMGAGAEGLTDLGGGMFMTADGAITGAGGLGAPTLTNAGIQSAIGTGGTSTMGAAGGGGFFGSMGNAGSSISSAVQSLLGGGGTGGMSWSSLITPAMQLLGGAITNHQAGEAADAQINAANNGIAENRRQFDTVRELLAPYVGAGNEALGNYRALSGSQGPDAQRAAIEALKGTPQFGMLVDQGEEAILQNASATGGLRGGNTQAGLADYRTKVLSGLIDQQLGRYGSLINVGQNSAAGTGSAAMTTGQNVAGLMQQSGAAQAGGITAGTSAITNALGGVGGFFSGYGGTSMPTTAPVQHLVSSAEFAPSTPNYGFTPGRLF